ncbi:MAG: type II toxin-antitoxin system RelE/ParE family toxin [Ignavibacteria bacterium]|jgi:hypothetical protein|nr:type II toxin-antitoxin system RelE/ParE family toxin [Ignavibacteria bacterium]
MSFTVEPSQLFIKKLKPLLKKYHSLEEDIDDLVSELKDHPTLGTPLGKNAYKIRLGIGSKGNGKSGGGRVITLVKFMDGKVVLSYIYDKSEVVNLTDSELQAIINEMSE